ncbi:aldolase/citrate lyase family protein [Microbacterium sp. zg.B48]|uniref:HpcH/HpaI aldolase family protein n=1 Tax=Microbacterium sp. zg.B48 TaxID=2969408 RepID=UPI00214A8CC1|nr:aldolase/citrate lyase family protein [Microbacterium sp. zg.B48]MCR2764345.1 aldolase/citrate lyase family protein [Microbacterium sp. zg.B48]
MTMPFHPTRGLKRAMKDGELKLGVFVGSASAQVAEAAALAGVDYLIADLEHGERVDTISAAEIIRAAEIAKTPVIVRVPGNNVDDIAAVLDHGAIGICVPHVRTREDAERAVSYARYAPVGVRAMSPYVRAAEYSGAGWDEYWTTANEEIIVMVIVEDRIAMSNLEEIASVPGLDVIWIGVGDLSQDLGIPLQVSDPQVVDSVQRGLDAARKNDVISFTTATASVAVSREARVAQLRTLKEQGFAMLAWVDTPLLSGALGELWAGAAEAADRA